MQAYDFVHLNTEYGCTLQYGGGDQWGNIVAGVELQRKLNFANGTNVDLIGATNPLLLTAEGKKMGKTEKGAIWMDRDKISAYDFYQGVYQTPDECVEMMFALFTDEPMENVRKLIAEDIVSAKKKMAYEITRFVRGKEDADIAVEATKSLFGGGSDMSNVPTYELDKAKLGELTLCDLLFESKLVASKSEGRRMCEQGGVSVNGEVNKNFGEKINENHFVDGIILLKKGKKNFVKVVLA